MHLGVVEVAVTIQDAILAGTLAPGDEQLRRLARVAEWREQMAMVAG